MPVLALGFLIAAAIAVTGVGGGVLTAPLLILWLGMPAPEAIGTSLLFVTAVKVLSGAAYMSKGHVDFRVLRYLLAGGIPGVTVGSLVLQRLHGGNQNAIVLSLVGMTVLVSASLNLVRAGRPERRASSRPVGWLPPLAGAVGVEVGFSAAGAGALGTQILQHFTGLTAPEIVGTDLLFGLAISAIGGGLHFAAGNWNPEVLTELIAGGVPGTLAGVFMARRMPARVARVVLSTCCALLGARLCWYGISLLTPLLLERLR